MKKFKIAIIALMTASLLLTAISFAYLNDVIPLHFGVNGQPDYYGSKYWLLLLNAITIVLGVAQIAYCQYSNATENYKKQLLLTGTIIQVVFLVIFGAMIAYAWSYSEEVQAFDISKLIMIVMGVRFLLIGNYMPKIEKNRVLGVKTKWSLYNEVTWQKTHRFAGFASMIAGTLVLLLGLFFYDVINFIILIAVVAVFVVSTIVASYVYYCQEKRRTECDD